MKGMAALSFAVVDLIREGQLDRFLLRMRAAINERLATDEYKRHIIAGDDS